MKRSFLVSAGGMGGINSPPQQGFGKSRKQKSLKEEISWYRYSQKENKGPLPALLQYQYCILNAICNIISWDQLLHHVEILDK